MKTLFLTFALVITSITLSAQINIKKPNKNIRITNKTKIYKPIFPKMDAVIKEIIDGADEGTYQFTMARLTLGKEVVDSRGTYLGSMSYPSTSIKYYSINKTDELNMLCLFREQKTGANDEPVIRIYTTKIGGQYIKIKHKGRIQFRQLRNIKITKKGEHRFIITADYEKNGSITNYIFNIFRLVIQ